MDNEVSSYVSMKGEVFKKILHLHHVYQVYMSQSKNPAPFGFVFGGPLDFNLEEWQAKR